MDNLEDQVKAHIYRFVLESLTNVERHSQATKIEIIVDRAGSHLGFSVFDNGLGLQKERKEGIGHRNLSERAKEVNGTFEFSSSEQGSRSVFFSSV